MKKSARDALVAGWLWVRACTMAHGVATVSAIGLVLLITVTHYAYDPLALLIFGDAGGRASRALAYVLRGHEGFWLFLAVGFLARRRVVWLACVFGMAEEAQTAICRLRFPLTEPPPFELFTGLCGQTPYAAGLAVAATLALIITRRK